MTLSSSLRLATPPARMSVVHHSGPGLRLVFWVQGCVLRCTQRCLNPELLSTTGGHLVTAEELTRELLRKAADYREAEGVTVLGGEPFEQAAALAAALTPVRAAGLSVMCYSGHLLEDLQASPDPGAHTLLALCDLLVDGPFREELYDPTLLWRGSRNQRILRLSDRYSEADLEAAMARQGRSLWISRSPQGDIVASGAQSREIVSRQRRAATVVREKRR